MFREILAAAGLLLGCAASGAGAQTTSPLAAGAHRFRVGQLSLWYRVAGRTRGIPIVFLHGGPGEGSQAFQAVGGPALERTQRLVYFDQRGSGRSDRPPDPSNYSRAIMVDDIERLRTQLGVPRIVLLGHSFGTQLALEYAVRYPRRVAAIVLAGTSADEPRSQDLQCERLAREDPAAFARAAAGIEEGAVPRCDTSRAYSGNAARMFATRNLFPDPAVGRKVDALDAADGLGNSGEAVTALLGQGLLQYRFGQASRVAAPVLVIAGGRDFDAALAVQRDLVRALPNARLIEYPTNGHFMFVEDPERFARDVAAFLHGVTR